MVIGHQRVRRVVVGLAQLRAARKGVLQPQRMAQFVQEHLVAGRAGSGGEVAGCEVGIVKVDVGVRRVRDDRVVVVERVVAAR